MKPVLVLQHLPDDGPAYLATWLAAQGRTLDLRHASAGDTCPAHIDGFAALAVLGGAWSANDDRPWLRQVERLISQAVADGVPVLGHCLGGQLMARTLGAAVGPAPMPERGWHELAIAPGSEAQAWFGPGSQATVFQWHVESFSLPAGAERLSGSAACPNQAFARGPHLAMQFHIEVDEQKLQAWSSEAASEPVGAVPDGLAAGWHGAARMRADTHRHLATSQRLASQVYGRWLHFAR